VNEPVNVWDYEALAAERLEAGAHGYYAGGAGDELTLRDNVEAYRRWQLRPRLLVDVAACTTATTVLGHDDLQRLTPDDLIEGARALGEEPAPPRGGWFNRRR